MPWVSRYADPVMATGYHMLLGGVPLLALSIIQESDVLLERLPQLTGEPHMHLTLDTPALASNFVTFLADFTDAMLRRSPLLPPSALYP